MTQALVTLFVGLAGLAAAWLYFAVGYWAMLAAVPLVSVGWGANWIGERRVARDPVGALPWLEAWVLLPAVIAAAAAGVVFVLTIKLAPPETMATPMKEFVTQGVALLTAFIVAIAVKQMDEADALVSGHVKRVFNRVLHPLVSDDDKAARGALQSPQFTQDAEGWGWEARRARARVLARALTRVATGPTRGVSR